MADSVLYNSKVNNGSFSYDKDNQNGSLVYSDDGIRASRVLPTFTGTEYGTLDTPITFTGDFEVEFEFACTDVTSNRAIAGGSTGRPVVQLDLTAGTLSYTFLNSVAATVSVVIPAIDWSDGKLHKGKAYRTGDTFYLECEGNIVSATHTSAPSQTWNKVGAYTISSSPFYGQILSTTFTDKSGANDVITRYEFDSGSTLYQMARGEGLGNDVIAPLDDTDWTNDGSGNVVVSNNVVQFNAVDTSYIWGQAPVTFTAGKSYTVTTTVTNYVSGQYQLQAKGTSTENIALAQTGSATFLYSAVSGNTALEVARTVGTTLDADILISVQELPDNTCLLTNFTSANWSRYTLQRNILHDAGTIAQGWVGDNIVVNGRFNDGSTWSLGIGWTISGGIATSTPPNSAWTINQNIGMGVDSNYLAVFDLSVYNAGTLELHTGGASLQYTAAARYTSKIAADTDTLYFKSSSAVNFDGSIDNVSVQHLLEIA